MNAHMRLARFAAVVAIGSALAMSGAGCVGSRTEERRAPDFALQDVAGREVRLSELDGQVRLVDFWATWCAPCREEIPMLNELQKTYGDRGFRVLAISEEDEEIVRKFVQEHGVDYTSLIGNEEVTQSYEVYGLPTAYLLDGEGRVITSYMGAKPRAVLEKKIQELLAAAPAS